MWKLKLRSRNEIQMQYIGVIYPRNTSMADQRIFTPLSLSRMCIRISELFQAYSLSVISIFSSLHISDSGKAGLQVESTDYVSAITTGVDPKYRSIIIFFIYTITKFFIHANAILSLLQIYGHKTSPSLRLHQHRRRPYLTITCRLTLRGFMHIIMII